MPTLPAAISRRAMTVALSRSPSRSGCDPALIWRARLVAASVSSKRFGIRVRQSSMVMRAMGCFLDEFVQQRTVAEALLAGAQAGRPHNGIQVLHRRGKVLINNNIIKVFAVPYLFPRGLDAACDGRPVVLATADQ